MNKNREDVYDEFTIRVNREEPHFMRSVVGNTGAKSADESLNIGLRVYHPDHPFTVNNEDSIGPVFICRAVKGPFTEDQVREISDVIHFITKQANDLVLGKIAHPGA